MISLSPYRAATIAHASSTTREMDKLVLSIMLVSLENTTVEAKTGATIWVMEDSPVK